MSCCDLGLKGTLSASIMLDGSVIEEQIEDEISIGSGEHELTITHEKEGYTSYLYFCPQYGITNNVFVYVTSITQNAAVLRVNNTGSAVTMSIGTTMWLCIPDRS